MMLMRKFSLVLTLACTTMLFSQQASAHAHLKSQYPAAEATMEASPQALTLTFSEDIEPAFSGVEVSDGQQVLPLGKAGRAPKQHNQLIIPIEEPLPAGKYQVKWHVLSVDGHKTKGQYSFSVK